MLYRVARRLTLDPWEAEDLVGATLMSAAKGWNGFDGAYPRSWLIKILKNEHLASLRRKGARPLTVPLDNVDIACEGVWREVDWRIAGSQVLHALDNLPEEFRLAVALCDVEEMSYEEAAKAMEVPVGTVKSRLFRGRRILRERLASLIPGTDPLEVNASRLTGEWI